MHNFKKQPQPQVKVVTKSYSPVKAVMESGDSWRYHSAVSGADVFTRIALRDPTIDSAEYALMRLFEKGQLPRVDLMFDTTYKG